MTTSPPEQPRNPEDLAIAHAGFPVVGIGASEGGINALVRLLENAPTEIGMAFVAMLDIPLSSVPEHLTILQQATRMRVLRPKGTVRLSPNHLYLIFTGERFSVDSRCLRVGESEAAHGAPATIDGLFRALAVAKKEQAFAIVLSGTGSNGAAGLSRVIELGGITFAQQPDEAEFSEMPRNAIATAKVDIVLPTVDIPQKLMDLLDTARRTNYLKSQLADEPAGTASERDSASDVILTTNGRDAPKQQMQSLMEVLAYLRLQTDHDFGHYKPAILLRRIERRMQVNAVVDVSSYNQFLRQTPSEVFSLLTDLLNGATSFLRDPLAFNALEREVRPLLMGQEVEAQPLRIWSAGCSTGEEAYSLAMSLTRLADFQRSRVQIQVFATDIDETAIERAREGIYPKSISADVPPEIVDNYLLPDGVSYKISRHIRDKILFAVHSILSDAPFSELDVIACRNLLLRFSRSTQRDVLKMFHFALRPSGLLFLGMADSADVAEDLFKLVDKENRIYRALEVKADGVANPRQYDNVKPHSALLSTPGQSKYLQLSAMHQRAREKYSPASAVVDRKSQVIHLSDTASRFLHLPGEDSFSNIVGLVLPDLRSELRTTIYRALAVGSSVESRAVQIWRNGDTSWVQITARPFRDRDLNANLVLIFFLEVEERMSHSEILRSDPIRKQLEDELQASRDQSTVTVHRLQTTIEELKAANEELRAINEELRFASASAESEAEKLLTMIEELKMMNRGLETRANEYNKASDDLQSIIASSEVATLLLDKELRLVRYTRNAPETFNLIGSDIGRLLFDITHKLDYRTLEKDLEEALSSLKTIEREARRKDGRWFLTRSLPYRTADGRVDGAVLTLVDITERRNAEQAPREGEDRIRLVTPPTSR